MTKRDETLAHSCPKCGVAAGEPCRNGERTLARGHSERSYVAGVRKVAPRSRGRKPSPVRAVPCPTCGAEAGEPCRNRSGGFHRARERTIKREAPPKIGRSVSPVRGVACPTCMAAAGQPCLAPFQRTKTPLARYHLARTNAFSLQAGLNEDAPCP